MGTNVGGHGTGKRYPKARTLGQAGPSNVFPCLSLSCTHTQKDTKHTTKACSESNMRNTGTEMIPGDLYHGTDWLWSSFALNLVRRIGDQQQEKREQHWWLREQQLQSLRRNEQTRLGSVGRHKVSSALHLFSDVPRVQNLASP